MNEQDKALFEEYFQLEHKVDINVQQGVLLSDCPDEDEFEAMIPVPFKLASEMKGVEQNMLRPLRQLGDVIEPLADYLKAQSRKIDLMMSYILQAQDDSDHKTQTVSYGGGGFVFTSIQQFDLDSVLECKLFFSEEASAIYCLGRIIEVNDVDVEEHESPLYQYAVVFHRIREDDRELVVRASLHQQSKQLLKKTKQRQSENQ
ncbi:PilZ domain-containing protein [Psychrosphaera ytuae]|uniref:PilZ domain-containing protein n=1 Tax=Psychrosphaera ytuae TaxID=2820710 RepID=A0A975DBL8_9GAMM|nr:PilZ domain-containing protein [Psychrosphaera ytuae]QTH64157.1 PilZ domain-containing protein [Psychrosphaera ytuae]